MTISSSVASEFAGILAWPDCLDDSKSAPMSPLFMRFGQTLHFLATERRNPGGAPSFGGGTRQSVTRR